MNVPTISSSMILGIVKKATNEPTVVTIQRIARLLSDQDPKSLPSRGSYPTAARRFRRKKIKIYITNCFKISIPKDTPKV